jgi:hypothetical protein
MLIEFVWEQVMERLIELRKIANEANIADQAYCWRNIHHESHVSAKQNGYGTQIKFKDYLTSE